MKEEAKRLQASPWLRYSTDVITGCPYQCGQTNIKSYDDELVGEVNFTQKCTRCKQKYKVKGKDFNSSWSHYF